MTVKLSEAVELLPCPFCGHPESVSLDRCLSRLAYVECLGCSAHGPAKDHERGAIAEWNTRSSLKGDEEMVAKLSDDECAICGKAKSQHSMSSGYGVCQIYPVFVSKQQIVTNLLSAIGEVR
jgi:Lar family restriction alleviation protein